MMHLKPAQKEQLERLLDTRLRELREDIRRELLQSEHQHHRDVAGMVSDVGDEAVANLVADLDAAAIDRDVVELRAVEAARERLRSGTYGLCLDCGNAILWPRLLAMPSASRCIACTEKYEKTHAHPSRPSL